MKRSKKKPKRPRGFGAVFQRGRIWWYRCPGEPSKSSKSTTKEIAEGLLQKRLDELRIGEATGLDPGRATYEDLERALLADLRAKQRRSIDNVEKFRLPRLRAFFGGMRARDINYNVLNAYVVRRLEAARPATVLYELKLLKRAFTIALRAELVHRVPAFPTVGVGDNARKGFATPEEIERVVSFLPEHAKAPVQCLYLTGWRTGEVLRLTWARVDFEAGTLSLHASDTKSGKPRTFPFTALPALAELLREQRARTSVLEREQGRIVPWVFHLDGVPLSSIRSGWRTAVKSAGLPGLRPHDLRRSAARNLVRAGVSEGVVMRLCGWSTRSMFDRYNVADQRDLKEGVERLGAFLERRRAGAARLKASGNDAAL